MSVLKKNLRLRLVANFLLIALLGISAAVLMSYFASASLIQQTIFDRIRTIADLKTKDLRIWINDRRSDLEDFKDFIEFSVSRHPEAPENEIDLFFLQTLQAMKQNRPHDLSALYFLDGPTGKVLHSTNANEVGLYRNTSVIFREGLKDTYVSG